MTKDVRVVLDREAINYLLESEHGPTGQYLLAQVIKGERISKTLVNVDTGRLRSSITHEVGHDYEGLYGAFGTDVDYGIYQELDDVRGKPFLRPALYQLG